MEATEYGRKITSWSVSRSLLCVHELLTNRSSDSAGEGGTGNWHEVAKRVPGQNNKDCRKGYHKEMDGDVKKDTWTNSEDQLLKGP